MPIVSFNKYRSLTKDYDTEGADIEENILIAQSLLEERLHRKFDEVTVVDEEVAVLFDQRHGYYKAYPEHMPVTSVTTSGWQVMNTGALRTGMAGTSIVFNLDQWGRDYVTYVSYTGGYTNFTAPRNLQLAISLLAKILIGKLEGASELPSGISNAKVGGISVNLSSDNAGDNAIPGNIWNLAYPYRRVV